MEDQLRDRLYNERFARDKERIENHEKHMERQDEERRELRELTIEMSEMIKRHDERIAEHGSRIAAIEQKPGRRWEMVVDKIITLLVAAAVAYFTANK